MIQPQTHLNVADNSRARKLMCIRIIGASNRRYAQIGDVVVAVIKEAIPNTPLERSEVIRAVIVRTCTELKRKTGMIIRYDDNAAVVIDQEGNPKKGTRIFGAISRELSLVISMNPFFAMISKQVILSIHMLGETTILISICVLFGALGIA